MVQRFPTKVMSAERARETAAAAFDDVKSNWLQTFFAAVMV